MANVKIRDFDKSGVVKDTPSTLLPPMAFSAMNNIELRDGAIRRSPIFADVGQGSWGSGGFTAPPQAFLSHSRATGIEDIFLCNSLGEVSRFVYQGSQDVSPSLVYQWPGGDVVTSATVSEVNYFAHPNGPLIAIDGSKAQFEKVNTNRTGEDTESFWRVVRGFGDRVVLFNHTTPGGDGSPTRIRWSEPVLAGTIAYEWEWASETATAGQSEIPSSRGPLLDAMPLDNQMLIYSTGSVHRMSYSGDEFIFNIDSFMMDDGVLATGLVGLIDGIGHFVVGNKSIYLTDGRTKKDIAAGRVEAWFRKYMVESKRDRFFLRVDRSTQEVMLAFVSSDPEATFPPDWCNRALVWNYASDIWTMRDLPNMSTLGDVFYQKGVITWAGLGEGGDTWTSIALRWSEMVGPGFTLPMGFSAPLTGWWSDAQLMTMHPFFDYQTTKGSEPTELGGGSFTKTEVDDTELTGERAEWDARNAAPAYVERLGLIFDEFNLPTSTQKLVNRITMHGDAYNGKVFVSVGTAASPNSAYTLLPTQEVDFQKWNYTTWKAIGRYHGYRIASDGNTPIMITGVDINVDPISLR
jgi:hypothetical protein